jgi:hypothetical protein
MIIQGHGAVTAYTAMKPASGQPGVASPAPSVADASVVSTRLSLSDEARALAASEVSRSPGGPETAEEIDRMQKAHGLVNTFANLSASEKKLYNDFVEKGDMEAAKGIALIALGRMGSGDVTLPDGRTFNPRDTEITAKNVRELFSRMFASADRVGDPALDALANSLERMARQG